jgi:hypothetical protein
MECGGWERRKEEKKRKKRERKVVGLLGLVRFGNLDPD